MKKLINLKKKYITQIFLILILLLSFYLRTFNINWDQNFYFHPDERAIVMFTIPISIPVDLEEFINTNSPLNPHFFAYGNMPLYLLKITGEIASYFNPILNDYGGIHLVGRFLSAIFDTLTVFLVFLLGTKVFSRRTGIWASVLYTLSVFPIQVSHFFAVDTILTFFLTLSLYLLFLIFEKPEIKNSILLGVFFGLSIATKISALIFIPTILLTYIFLFINKKLNVIKFTLFITLVSISCFIFFVFTQPYTIIDFKEFLSQTNLQTQMSKNAFIFPYTLQYVGKISYWYELKNIFFWGLGPLIASLSYIGIFAFSYMLIKKKIKHKLKAFLLLFYLISYFLIFGSFAVGWMRYMLPIYPLLAIFGGFLISDIIIKMIPKYFLKNAISRKFIAISSLLIIFIYPLSFLSIYSKPNTRLQATEWMLKNIPAGSNIAVEHWDDVVPIYGGEKYQINQLPLYESDTNQKWEAINQTLTKTDYIILASNRLYIPLQKLTDCKNLPPGKCYPQTSEYYKRLFSENLGFKKIIEFSSYPTIPFAKIKLVDDNADESFTVYDHPKILIFKKK